ncbi:hypothetical protein [Microbacterium gilvum]|uniref:Uncharacterized protein n=1 Tax=Microbacterium gilvum TaxID=1336204 RepID=A0ABP9A595_9MICO
MGLDEALADYLDQPCNWGRDDYTIRQAEADAFRAGAAWAFSHAADRMREVTG